MDSRLERQARNEALIREVNERIERLDKEAEAADLGNESARFEFLCECGVGDAEDLACQGRVEMTLGRDEGGRGQDELFAPVPGPETESTGRLVPRARGYAIIRKN